MSARTHLAVAFVLAVTGLSLASGCSGSLGTGSGPTTTEKPLAPKDMCVAGQNVFTTIDELDRTKPDYLDKVKAAVKSLPTGRPRRSTTTCGPGSTTCRPAPTSPSWPACPP